jgi:hypothetical protein
MASLDEIYEQLLRLTSSIGDLKAGQADLGGRIGLIDSKVEVLQSKVSGNGLEGRIAEMEGWVKSHPPECLYAVAQEERDTELKEATKEKGRRRFDARLLVVGIALTAIVGIAQYWTSMRIESKIQSTVQQSLQSQQKATP